MSGIEILGIVANALQIAEIGMKLSVKICSFYRQMKDTNRSMKSLSNDVSLTCSILHQLGVTLQQDDQTKIYSVQAYHTAQKVLNECKTVFQQIDDAIEAQDTQAGKNRLRREARRLAIAFVGPDLEVLKSNLERVKSTILLMLNVILYAGQVRRQDELALLEKQRELIQKLMDEKNSNEARYDQLSLDFKSVKPRENEGFQLSTTCKPSVANEPAYKQAHFDNELETYYLLIQTLLHEIDACRSNLEQARHLRIRNGLVNVHSTEALLFQHTHGPQTDQIFGNPIFKHQEAQSFDEWPAPNNTNDGQQAQDQDKHSSGICNSDIFSDHLKTDTKPDFSKPAKINWGNSALSLSSFEASPIEYVKSDRREALVVPVSRGSPSQYSTSSRLPPPLNKSRLDPDDVGSIAPWSTAPNSGQPDVNIGLYYDYSEQEASPASSTSHPATGRTKANEPVDRQSLRRLWKEPCFRS